TIRTEQEKYAHNHIVDSDCVNAFCGQAVPAAVIECGVTDLRNPYVGKGRVTCGDCLSELKNGRRNGYSQTT
ncbi:MAG TPA: hypothetical protein VN039_03840, partial [Nitrospira sp.]|nr:hypothetical protein [Nitrospira sp.]